ncbi:ABC transporter permease [Paenibacillus sp. GCM10027626]|uniref:ABC transporter permease n=1 Tax=Paenibacillus sp. GCM10027626 TaxID=3273411 RepID=UPI0036286B5E
MQIEGRVAARPGEGWNTTRMSRFGKLIRNVIKYKALLVMMIPALVVVVINCYMPMIGVLIAFKNVNYAKGIFGSKWVGFENFRFLFTTDTAWRITINTVSYSLLFIILGLFIVVSTSIALSEVRNKRVSKVYQTAMLLPNFLSIVVVSYIVYALLNPDYGFINKSILEPLGLTPVNWYNESTYWPYILTSVHFWMSTGMSCVIYLAAISGIDQEMYEAAIVDGATKWQQIRKITLPSLKPIMIILLILSIGNIFRSNFGLFYQVPLNAAALYPATDTIDTYVYRAMISLGDIGMSSAAGLYQSVVGAVLVILSNAIVRRIDKDQSLF